MEIAEGGAQRVEDHDRMDKTQYTGLVTVVILSTFTPTLIALRLWPLRVDLGAFGLKRGTPRSVSGS